MLGLVKLNGKINKGLPHKDVLFLTLFTLLNEFSSLLTIHIEILKKGNLLQKC